MNGDIHQSFAVGGNRAFARDMRIDIRQGSWIALRATARDDLLSGPELVRYSAGADDEPLRVRPSTLRFAHTSPIYVTVDGRGPAVAESYDEATRMLDAFEAWATRNVADDSRAALVRDLATARAKLSERSRAAVPDVHN